MMRDIFEVRRGGFFSVLFLIAIAAVGCAKDQTTDEAHDQKVNETFALYQSVAGTYRGVLTSKADGSTLGAIQIDLDAKKTQINSSDDTGKSFQATMQGKVTLNNSTQSEAIITDAGFFPDGTNSTSGTFSGTLTIPMSDGSTVQSMTISGNIANNILVGQLSVETENGIEASFTVTKNALLNQASVADSSKVSGAAGNTLNYAGKVSDQAQTEGADSNNTAALTVTIDGQTSAETFLNNFSYQKKVKVQLILNLSNSNGSLPFSAQTFEDANLDTADGTLHGDTSQSGDITALVSLNCNMVNRAKPSAGWDCTYLSHFNGVTHHFIAQQTSSP